MIDDTDDDDDDNDSDDVYDSGPDGEDNDDIDDASDEYKGRKVTSYKKRRAALASALASQPQRPKQTWEGRYDNDPLRGDSPTQDFLKEASRFNSQFTAICNDFSSKSVIDLRDQIWIPHLQWARRSALAGDSRAAVKQEFTRLSNDLMQPIGQILKIHANSTDDVRQLLQSEPFLLLGVVDEWNVYRVKSILKTNLTNSMIDPKIFIGIFEPDVVDDKSLLEEQVKYHEAAGTRVIIFNWLYDDDDVLVGVQIVFNAKSNMECDRYISGDPMRKYYKSDHIVLGPINEQDVDGLHHSMPRSFSELTQLEQIHFMDPEDIFLGDDKIEEGLEKHFAANKLFLEKLNAQNISFRYDRLNLQDFVADDISKKTVATRNYEMSKFQRVRLHSAVEEIDPGNNASPAGIMPAETIQEE